MTSFPMVLALLAATAGGDAAEPLLLHFHATWCGPCRTMKPAVDEVKRAGYPVRSVDIDRDPELAGRYDVDGVPCVVAVDADGNELTRVKGPQSAGELAAMYRRAKSSLGAGATVPASDRVAAEEPAPEEEPAGASAPRPWETVVRIKVMGVGSIGFGSGTVIYSDDEQAIILSCAHIFQTNVKYSSPAKFPHKVIVELFDGRIRTRGSEPGSGPGQVLHTGEKFAAEVIDHDFVHDVSLMRIRPGKRLPASPVVPAGWSPRRGMKMITVGCSEGRDATAWDTHVTNPKMRGLSGRPTYEAIECAHPPKQGRSGGGLYTPEGYVAGVCDFAEPRGGLGLYASPASIHRLLQKNGMDSLYRGGVDTSRIAAAGRRPAPERLAANRGGTRAIARAQSPDDAEELEVPDPGMLGIRTPEPAAGRPSTSVARRPASAGAGSWRTTATTQAKDAQSAFDDVPESDPADDATAVSNPEDLAPAKAPAPAPRRRSAWSAIGQPAAGR